VFVDQANNKLGREFSEVVKMQNQIDMVKDEAEVAASISAIKGEEWGNCSSVEDQPSFQEEEAAKVPYVGDKVRANIKIDLLFHIIRFLASTCYLALFIYRKKLKRLIVLVQ